MSYEAFVITNACLFQRYKVKLIEEPGGRLTYGKVDLLILQLFSPMSYTSAELS